MYGVYCITRARCLTAHPVLGLTELKSKAPSFVLFQRSASTACSLLIVLVALLMSRPVEWDSGRAHEESQECPMPLRTGESSVTSQKCPVMPCLTGSSVPLRILEGLQNYIKLGWSINVYWGLSCFIWARLLEDTETYTWLGACSISVILPVEACFKDHFLFLAWLQQVG